MNTLYENMKRFGTKNLQESIWDIGALLRNRSDIINLAKPVVTPNPENPRKRYWREQPDGSLKYYHDKKGTIPWTEKDNQVDNDLLILEAVCVQHEIDHLNGKTIYDREFKRESFRRTEVKIGRNEKVTITKDKETLTMKYKKAIPYLEKGWVINGH